MLGADRITQDELPAESLILGLYQYWLSQAKDGCLPARRDIDPLDIAPAILPWVFMLDVLDQPSGRDYRFRLNGTSNITLVGRDPTNKLASEVFGKEEHRFLIHSFDTTVQEMKPKFWRARVPQDLYGQVRVCRGLFPLSDDGVAVNMILGIAVPD